MKAIQTFLLLFSVILMSGCYDATEEDEPATSDRKITFQIVSFEQTSFETRAESPISALATRLNFAAFNTSGERVKTLSQKGSDNGFGTLSVNLNSGTYTIVIVAHSQTSSASMTSPLQVQFGNPLTDVFYYSGQITVSDDETQTHPISLKRAVAMFRFSITDGMPANVRSMKFSYSGGSIRLNPATGYGTSNSNQYAEFIIPRDMVDEAMTFEMYTIPHEEDDVLTTLTVEAIDSVGATFLQRSFHTVPIKTNQITSYKGPLFTGGDQSVDIQLTADGAWASKRTFVFN